MASRLGTVTIFAVALLAGLIAAGARTVAEAHRPVAPERLFDVPSIPAEIMRPLTFGFRSFAGHLAYLEAIQVYGERHHHKLAAQQLADDRALTRLLGYSVDLDEKFVGVYRFIGNALPRETLDGKAFNVLATIRLLEKGVRERPDYWQTPFLLGFLQSYYLGDSASASRNIELASKQEGAPAYLGLWATRLAADAGQVELAQQMARQMIDQAQDDETRKEWERRLKELDTERDLREIEAAARLYKERSGKEPATVAELVAAGLLRQVPVERNGGSYVLDPRTGEARSTKAQRLRVRGRRQATAGLEVH